MREDMMLRVKSAIERLIESGTPITHAEVGRHARCHWMTARKARNRLRVRGEHPEIPPDLVVSAGGARDRTAIVTRSKAALERDKAAVLGMFTHLVACGFKPTPTLIAARLEMKVVRVKYCVKLLRNDDALPPTPEGLNPFRARGRPHRGPVPTATSPSPDPSPRRRKPIGRTHEFSEDLRRVLRGERPIKARG